MKELTDSDIRELLEEELSVSDDYQGDLIRYNLSDGPDLGIQKENCRVYFALSGEVDPDKAVGPGYALWVPEDSEGTPAVSVYNRDGKRVAIEENVVVAGENLSRWQETKRKCDVARNT